MEKQGRSSADRPRQVAAGEILSGEQSVAFTHAGERFRRMRRALHSHLHPNVADTYQPLQMSYMKNVVHAILDDPDNFQNHALTFTASAIMQVAYGKTAPTFATDPEVRSVRQRFVALSKAMRPGTYLVDSIPWLKYVPWYGRELREEFETNKRFYTSQLNHVKQQIQNNEDISPSFSKYMLENNHLYGFSETEVAFLAGGFIIAGMHSTAVTIATVLMAAACFPDEQAKVQAELDAVIGSHQAPTFDDQQSLPRLQAFISEVHRWRPSAPEGVSHRMTEDVIWASENYCIPAGTTVIGSVWAISRDPEVFPEPDAFKPDRWLNDQGRLTDDLKFYPFGFGRRVCPGQHLAQRAVFIHTLVVLWAFQLTLDRTKPLNDMGYMNSVMPDDRQCHIGFKTRIPETELRLMMQNYPATA
ncbi:hypothetical protein AZE42_02612 [Rhizopogon vesiculosus]|uniref:Cytochrome P450 n=1 Tax=Rhizopogon vesiculosus TaxID=180088 RepID=A0A1J8Q822_9AGAM|nr:hypothetical protein AZE42_02612 [Rhizopogon vesiculosus]